MLTLLKSVGILVLGLVILISTAGIPMFLFATIVRYPDPGWKLAAAAAGITTATTVLGFKAFRKLCKSAQSR